MTKLNARPLVLDHVFFGFKAHAERFLEIGKLLFNCYLALLRLRRSLCLLLIRLLMLRQ